MDGMLCIGYHDNTSVVVSGLKYRDGLNNMNIIISSFKTAADNDSIKAF